MARKSAAADNTPTIAELQRMLATRQGEINRLVAKRQKVQARLEDLDRQIAEAGGGANGSTGGRARNAMSLGDAIEQVLRNAGGAQSVGDIVAGVQKSGYQSNSVNFRGIVNQALIKDKRFTSAERGSYQLKK